MEKQLKVLMLNGSPREQGNIALAVKFEEADGLVIGSPSIMVLQTEH